MNDLLTEIEDERRKLMSLYGVLHCLERTLTYGNDVGPESIVASHLCELISDAMERLDRIVIRWKLPLDDA
jgi:hypothetical protein